MCSLETSSVLCHIKYPSGGSFLIWAPLTVDSSGMTLIAGFTDGVLRYCKYNVINMFIVTLHQYTLKFKVIVVTIMYI